MTTAVPDRPLSLWHDQAAHQPPRPSLPGDASADVAIVGAGFTGLWTAFHLAQADPTLRITVLERDVAGFGASGRNGGWCSALFPASWRRMARAAPVHAVIAMQRALEASVDEVGTVATQEGIDCHYVRGGSLSLLRNVAQQARAIAEVAEARAWGFGAETVALLSAEQTAERLRAPRSLGALATAACASLQPAMLVQGLADAVERRGVRLHEQTEVVDVQPRRLVTRTGAVTADVVLVATEGYTAQLPGRRRELAPVYSLMLATEPLPVEVWDSIGLRDRSTFADHRHLTVYGQRTWDDRIAFGGRGAPYHFGSRVHPSYERVQRVHEALQASLLDLFPVLRDVRITHRWGGNLGVPRDWFPSVGLDRASGLAWAGGYVGDGVAASYLAGRTIADLVLGADTERTRLPWVRRRTALWEPEPLRWLGVNGVTALMKRADRTEERTGRPSRTAAAFWRAIGQ
ncbi:MAG: dependent oxidoreductase [Frankiales bacterium]|nr:dependent oxidoreductase [Frankiales bacterium]